MTNLSDTLYLHSFVPKDRLLLPSLLQQSSKLAQLTHSTFTLLRTLEISTDGLHGLLQVSKLPAWTMAQKLNFAASDELRHLLSVPDFENGDETSGTSFFRLSFISVAHLRVLFTPCLVQPVTILSPCLECCSRSGHYSRE